MSKVRFGLTFWRGRAGFPLVALGLAYPRGREVERERGEGVATDASCGREESGGGEEGVIALCEVDVTRSSPVLTAGFGGLLAISGDLSPPPCCGRASDDFTLPCMLSSSSFFSLTPSSTACSPSLAFSFPSLSWSPSLSLTSSSSFRASFSSFFSAMCFPPVSSKFTMTCLR
jgi:hypothetical protein